MYRTYNSDGSSRLDRKIDSARYVILCYVIHQILLNNKALCRQHIARSSKYAKTAKKYDERARRHARRRVVSDCWSWWPLRHRSTWLWRHADDGVTGETDVQPVVVVDVMTSCRWYIRSTNGNTMSAIIDTHYNYRLHREYTQYNRPYSTIILIYMTLSVRYEHLF